MDELQAASATVPTTAQSALMRVLFKLGFIGKSQLETRFLETDTFPVAFFAQMGCYDEAVALPKIAKELGLKFSPLDRETQVTTLALLDAEPCCRVDAAVWKEARALPLALSGEIVTVALANPLDIETHHTLEFHLQRRLEIVIAPEQRIVETLTQKYSDRDGLDFSTLLQTNGGLELKNTSGALTSLETNIANETVTAPTVIKLVNKIFASAIQRGASDIHITPQRNRLGVKIRVDGLAQELLQIPGNLSGPVISRIKILCGMDISEKRKPQDGRLRLKTNSGIRDLRISTVPTAYGEDLVARILDSEFRQTTFASLGMSDEAAALFRNILTRSSKVVLITGPTGSGKTSTLYAGVLHLRNANSRIITIEDPIEYRIEGISQIQVNPKIDMTFATALRSVLRQDPDVILVGEIRDAETATTAMQVAQTGHLVLSTLHTNTAASAITRLRDLGIASFLIASSLGTLVAQRLVRRLCSHCQIPISGEEEEKALKLGLDPALLASAKGCDECGGTGYRGRVALFSILDITPEVATAIRNELPEDEIEQAARSGGFWHLEEAVVPFLCSRTTSLSEAERVLGSLDTRLLAPHNPRPKSSSAVAQESVQRSPSKDSTVEIPKRRVMIVDDDEGIRAIFQSLLEFEMFEVVSAADGHEALKLIYEQQPELVLCDLMMPNMNGEELLGRLRGDARTREIPVLVLTAAATEENELDLLKKGADDFVSKTARAEIIVARINRLLNRVVA